MAIDRERLRSIQDFWSAFANFGNDGSYDFFTQIITLDSIEQIHVDAMLNHAPAGRNKVFRVAVHEYTHWLDHVATLWGRERLLLQYQAMAARSANAIDGFPAIVAAFEDLRRIRSERYFLVRGDANPTPPWAWDSSIGVRFASDGRPDEQDPIIFLRFLQTVSSPRGVIVRVPLTAIALTEANAQACELAWVSAEEQAFGNAATPANTQRWLEDFFRCLYDAEPQQTFYHAAFHMVANHCGFTAVSEIVAPTRALSTLALNMPRSMGSRMRPPSGLISENVPRFEKLLASHDVGAIFMVLCATRVQYRGHLVDWIEQILAAAYLPTLSELHSMALAEAAEQTQRAKNVGIPRLLKLVQTGETWLAKRGVLGEPTPLLSAMGSTALPLPGALLGDANIWHPGAKLAFPDHGTSTEAWFEGAAKLEHQIREFLAACGRGM